MFYLLQRSRCLFHVLNLASYYGTTWLSVDFWIYLFGCLEQDRFFRKLLLSTSPMFFDLQVHFFKIAPFLNSDHGEDWRATVFSFEGCSRMSPPCPRHEVPTFFCPPLFYHVNVRGKCFSRNPNSPCVSLSCTPCPATPWFRE